jgi:hypothetical protein
MSDDKKPFSDPLVREKLFPDPASVFGFAPVSLEEALKDGIVAIDTNVLLIPYGTGKASLKQIRDTYDRLVKKKRLRIPGQVAREFADHRAEKLKELFQQLTRRRNVNISQDKYPLLEGIESYSGMEKLEEEISSKLVERGRLIGQLLKTIEDWHWDDPVSEIYRELFQSPVVVDPKFDRDELLCDLKYRQEHRIPPGYKDANNEYSGVGDLLIWRTLLNIGEQESRHLIFVSGDEKADWRYKSEGHTLYPRFELVDEYRRTSGGKSFLIISFADILQQFGAPPLVVNEVKQEEAVNLFDWSRRDTAKSHWVKSRSAERAVFEWLKRKYPEFEIMGNRGDLADFIVSGETGMRAYVVKHFDPGPPKSLLKNFLRAAEIYSQTNNMPVTLVIVLGEDGHIRITQKIILEMRESGDLPSGNRQIG